MAIIILPLLNVSEKILADLKEEIGNIFLSRVEIAPPITSLGEYTYDKQREQYDAGKLVHYLLTETAELKADKIIAVGNMDMYLKDLNFVFGIAQISGRICAISLYRLDQRFHEKESDYDKLKERAVKEAVHELGHCFGLGHCENKGCVMVYSNHIMSVDEKSKFFCEDCREKLRKEI